jgi:glycerol-3-phosphate dehydrogenase
MADYDVAIIGGGINGCGIARDAAGRGLTVFLAEQGDLASATSSVSTKLIHGGLRYLENFHFRLVRESLRERAHLLTLAPHLVSPMRFVLPHVRGMRPAWMLRAGFRLYDWFGTDGRLPRTRALDLADDPAGAPLKSGFGLGFEYSDCIADDARLVVATAIGAREKGAVIRPRARCAAARREDGRWHLVIQSGGKRETVTARALVNATGPWVARVVETVLRRRPGAHARLVKGSHIVVPRLHAHDRAYVFQNDDQRFVFAVPFADDFTLIGTTEVELPSNTSEVAASSEEILYLCNAASSFFRTQVRPSKVKWTFAGVRTLVDDGSTRPSEVTRDYWIDVDAQYGEPPLLSIFGGKLTTYRALSEKVVDRLKQWLVIGPAWTHREVLPGGDLGQGGVEGLIEELRRVHSYLSEAHVRRLARSYGTLAWGLLGDAKRLEDLGGRIVANLYQAELAHLRENEWAVSVEDVLWRRTKLGLVASDSEVEALHAAMANGASGQRSPAVKVEPR